MRFLEAGLVATAAAVIAATPFVAIGTSAAATPTALVAGAFGAVAGWARIYEWRRPRGWAAFALDATWGLAGTALGLVLLAGNTIAPDPGYLPELSRRRNRLVFARGASLRRGFAFTLGPVMSNISAGNETIRPGLVEHHEELHIWQSRLFGPMYQATYVLWAALGLAVASVAWLRHRRTIAWFRLVETACYYDNPFEFWAYRRDERWPAGAHPALAWRARPPESEDSHDA